MNADIRWRQRSENFEKALAHLEEALAKVDRLSQLEKEGAVQRFEFTFELAWKTMKDYLAYQGIVLDQVTPRAVVRQAFAAKMIPDGQLWIDMMQLRNLLSHTYDETALHKALLDVAARYLPALQALRGFFEIRKAS